jgi:cysteine-rich repeat protein
MDGDTTLVIGDRRERGRLGEHAAGIRTVLERGQVADVFGAATARSIPARPATTGRTTAPESPATRCARQHLRRRRCRAGGGVRRRGRQRRHEGVHGRVQGNNICGDGKVGPGEGCDDGNQVDDDECTNACAVPGAATASSSMTRPVTTATRTTPTSAPPPAPNAACSDGFVQEGDRRGVRRGGRQRRRGACTTGVQGRGLRRRQRLQHRRRHEACDNGKSTTARATSCLAGARSTSAATATRAPTSSATTATSIGRRLLGDLHARGLRQHGRRR